MIRSIFSIIVILFVLTSCNQWKYMSEYDREADFDAYKTFGLLNWEKQNDEQVSQQTKEFLLTAIKEELESRGYTYQKKDANLQVSIYIVINEETSYSAYANQYLGYPGYAHIGVGVGTGHGGTAVGAYGYGVPLYPYTIVKHDHNVGALVIDLLDHSKKKLVWQGLATGRVAREEPTQAQISNDMARLFKDFPKKK